MFEVISCELGVGLVAANIPTNVLLAGSHGIVDGEGFPVVDVGSASFWALGVGAFGRCRNKEKGKYDGGVEIVVVH